MYLNACVLRGLRDFMALDLEVPMLADDLNAIVVVLPLLLALVNY